MEETWIALVSARDQSARMIDCRVPTRWHSGRRTETVWGPVAVSESRGEVGEGTKPSRRCIGQGEFMNVQIASQTCESPQNAHHQGQDLMPQWVARGGVHMQVHRWRWQQICRSGLGTWWRQRLGTCREATGSLFTLFCCEPKASLKDKVCCVRDAIPTLAQSFLLLYLLN